MPDSISKAQRLAKFALRGHRELYMRGAYFLHLPGHHRKREIRAVAFAAQMSEIQVAQFRAHYLFSRLSSGFVGKMSMPAQDALLQTPRPMWTILKHFNVVIGFQNQHVRGANPLQNQLGRMAQIRKKTNITAGGAQ